MPKPKKVEETRIEELEAKGSDKAEEHYEKEQGALMSSPMGKFLVIEVFDGYRVAKNHKWVSPVISSKEATKLASDMNRKDPEQKSYNRYLMGNTPKMTSVHDIQGLGE